MPHRMGTLTQRRFKKTKTIMLTLLQLFFPRLYPSISIFSWKGTIMQRRLVKKKKQSKTIMLILLKKFFPWPTYIFSGYFIQQ